MVKIKLLKDNSVNGKDYLLEEGHSIFVNSKQLLRYFFQFTARDTNSIPYQLSTGKEY